jgi:multimeric flavodoxin WrbA
MKVLLINGSPHAGGNTSAMLGEMKKVFSEAGVETEELRVGGKDIRGCIACGNCRKTGKCAFDDVVNEVAPKFEAADGLVVASPVYYASANGTLVSFLDRLFYSTAFDKTMKVGAAAAVARRGGITATFDELNKYFAISGMPIATGQYWNGAHGAAPGEAAADAEGMQQMRTLARNMVFLLRAIADAKAHYGLPEREAFQRTNFIR